MNAWVIRWVAVPLAYALSVIFFVIAISSLWSGEFYSAGLMLLLGFVSMPASWRRLSSALGRHVPIAARFGTAVVLLMFVSVAASADDERLAAGEARRAERARQADFETIRDSLYEQIASLSTSGEHERVVRIASEWSNRNDDSLEALKLEAQAIIRAARDSAREVELKEAARSIPAQDTDENVRVYEELASLDPDNEEYRTKLEHYREQARIETQRRQEERAAQARQRALEAKWSYLSDTDDMTGRTSRSARIRSENTVNFDFPYHGAQRATLTLRNHPSYGRDVIFRIEKGQILCRTYSRCSVRVRFDEGSPMSWGASPAADQSTTVVFLHSYNRFVSLLRQSQVVRIQPEIYQEGNPVFEFHVGGFDASELSGS